jgi:hypothetical protein
MPERPHRWLRRTALLVAASAITVSCTSEGSRQAGDDVEIVVVALSGCEVSGCVAEGMVHNSKVDVTCTYEDGHRVLNRNSGGGH